MSDLYKTNLNIMMSKVGYVKNFMLNLGYILVDICLFLKKFFHILLQLLKYLCYYFVHTLENLTYLKQENGL